MSTKVTKDEGNKAISVNVDSITNNSASNRVGKNIKNLSTVANLTKKSKFTKPKKWRFQNVIANSKMDFLIFSAKEIFI